MLILVETVQNRLMGKEVRVINYRMCRMCKIGGDAQF